MDNLDKINSDIIEWLLSDEVHAFYRQLCQELKKDRLYDFVYGQIYLHPMLCDKFLQTYSMSRYDDELRKKLYSIFANVYRKHYAEK